MLLGFALGLLVGILLRSDVRLLIGGLMVAAWRVNFDPNYQKGKR